MAIRSFFGYDDVPMPAGEQIPTAGLTLGPLPFLFKPGPLAAAGVTYTKESGWLKCKGTVTTVSTGLNKMNYLYSTLQSLGLTPTASSVFTIGMRWLCPINVTVSNYWPQPMEIVTAVSFSGFINGAVFPFGSIPNWVAGQEYYLEAQWDVAAAVIRRKVDGVPIADLPFTSGLAAAIAAGTAQFGAGLFPPNNSTPGTIEYSFWFKDMYVIEKTGDGTADTFLGAQRIVPITTASVDQASWLASPSGTPVDALNADITDAASLLTPVVTNDVTNNVANVGLTTPTNSAPINAVCLNIAGKKAAGASTSVTGQLITGSDQSAAVSVPMTSNMASGYKLYQGEKSPSGVKWTRAGILAAKLKLTVV